jgi:hypothetical protein
MPLSGVADLGLRADRAFMAGKVSGLGRAALLDAIKAQQGIERGGLFPTVQESAPLLIVGSTAQVAFASPARVYGVRAVSGSLKAVASTSTLDVVVQIRDGATVVVASFKLTSNEAGEAYFYGKEGIGFLCTTNVSVAACAIADGTSDPATGDKPTVTVLYG